MLHADAKSDLVEKYYQGFQAADFTDAHFVWADFSKEIPPAQQQEIIASIIDRGLKQPDNTRAIAYMLSLLSNDPRETRWNSHLERAVLTLTRSKYSVVHSMLMGILAKHNRAKYHAFCLACLNDPDDDVRYSAVNAIGPWPDGSNILNRYIQSHRSNADHANSVQRAIEYIGS